MNLLISIYPTLLMSLAAFGWLRGQRRRRSSDRAELILACGLLHASAWSGWNAGITPGVASQLWAAHLAATVALDAGLRIYTAVARIRRRSPDSATRPNDFGRGSYTEF